MGRLAHTTRPTEGVQSGLWVACRAGQETITREEQMKPENSPVKTEAKQIFIKYF